MLAITGWEEAGPPRRTSQEQDVASWKLGATGWGADGSQNPRVGGTPTSKSAPWPGNKRNATRLKTVCGPFDTRCWTARWQVKGVLRVLAPSPRRVIADLPWGSLDLNSDEGKIVVAEPSVQQHSKTNALVTSKEGLHLRSIV